MRYADIGITHTSAATSPTHLPERDRPFIDKKFAAIFAEAEAAKAEPAANNLARSLELQHPGAAASLREGLPGCPSANAGSCRA